MIKPKQTNGHRVWGALAALLALSASTEARADSLNCNSRIAETGDSRYEVQAICGKPDDASQHVEYRTTSGRVVGPCTNNGGKVVCEQTNERVVEVVIDDWTYDFGSNRFMEYLTFEQGRLVRVRDGGYGHK